MSIRVLINLSAERITFGLARGGRLADVSHHANDAAGLAAFAHLLAAHPDAPVYVMVDVAEEDFRSEALPHVWGRARKEMVERKLGQFFRALPYRAACLQGRVAGRRRDDQYLFVALSTVDVLRPYLERVAAQGAPLAGVWLLPLVSERVVAKLSGSGNVLMVSLQGGGLRQSLFVDGRLRISRLTPMEHPTSEALARLVAEEMEKSRLFLYNSRVLARDAPLEAWVLDADGRLRDACGGGTADPHFRCRLIDAETLARALGLSLPLPDMDTLMLSLLARHAPPCNLAPPQQTRGFTYHRLRRQTYALAAGVFALGLGLGGYHLFERQRDLGLAQQLRAEAARVEARYAERAREFPAAPASAEHMRRAVEAVGQLRALGRNPASALRLVGQVLPAYPQVELSHIVWRVGEPAATQGPPTFRPGPETLELAAEIRPFDGDYRAALALIGRLAQTLRDTPGVAQVRIAQLPVNLDPKVPLAGNTSEVPETAVAQFRLALVLGERP